MISLEPGDLLQFASDDDKYDFYIVVTLQTNLLTLIANYNLYDFKQAVDAFSLSNYEITRLHFRDMDYMYLHVYRNGTKVM